MQEGKFDSQTIYFYICSLPPILGKAEEMAQRKAGRVRKTKLPLKLDLPLI